MKMDHSNTLDLMLILNDGILINQDMYASSIQPVALTPNRMKRRADELTSEETANSKRLSGRWYGSAVRLLLTITQYRAEKCFVTYQLCFVFFSSFFLYRNTSATKTQQTTAGHCL